MMIPLLHAQSATYTKYTVSTFTARIHGVMVATATVWDLFQPQGTGTKDLIICAHCCCQGGGAFEGNCQHADAHPYGGHPASGEGARHDTHHNKLWLLPLPSKTVVFTTPKP